MRTSLRLWCFIVISIALFSPGIAGCNLQQELRQAESESPTVPATAAPQFSALSVKVSPAVIYMGQEIQVEAEITNTAGTSVTVPVGLIISGEEKQSKQLTLSPGTTGKLIFTYKPGALGKGTAGVAGKTAEFTVLEGKYGRSKAYGASLYFPGGWEASEGSFVTLTSKSGLTLKITASALPPNTDSAKFKDIVNMNLQGLPECNVISQVETKDGGGEYALRSEYSFLTGKLAYRGLSLCVKKGGYNFVAAAECMEAIWNDNRDLVEASLASFKVPMVMSGAYLNVEQGFAMTMPSGWQVIDTRDEDQPATIMPVPGQDTSSIAVLTTELTESTNPKSFLLSKLGTISKSYFGYTLVSQREIYLGGNAPGHEAVVKSQTDNEVTITHACCTLLQDRAYVIALRVRSSDYDQLKQPFQQLVSSFKPMEALPFGASRKDSLFLSSSEILSLDPAAGEESPEGITGAIFSGLVRQDGNLKAVPDIAEKWEISPDGKTYTFYLRDGVKFHNGKTVTAADFKYSWERAFDPKLKSMVTDIYLNDIAGAREMLDGKSTDLTGVKVVDDRTLQVSIVDARPYFLNKLCQPVAFVVDKNNVSKGESWSDKPIGTGPFKVDIYIKGEKLVLARSDVYYGEPAKLKNIVFQINLGSSLGLYEAGKVDVCSVSINNVDRVQDPAGKLNREMITMESYNTAYLAFNVTRPPFDDPKVRRAFALALNIDKIIEVSLNNMAARATGFIPRNIPGYNELNSPLRYDVEGAQKLLQESKYGSADKLPAVTITVLGSLSPVQEAMLGMWKQNLGIDVKVEVIKEPAEWKKRRFSKDLQLSTGSWRADYPDPQNFLEVLFESRSSQNRSNYTNQKIDAALLKAAGEPDSEKRIKMYQDIEKMLLDDLPAVPLYMNTKYFYLVKPYVRNYKLYPVGINRWRDISISR